MYKYLLFLILSFIFTGCVTKVTKADRETIIQNLNQDFVFKAYGQTLKPSRTFTKMYVKTYESNHTFYPGGDTKRTKHELKIGSINKNWYSFKKGYDPTYEIKFDKPQIVAKVNYVLSHEGAIKEFAIYRTKGKKYIGYSYNESNVDVKQYERAYPFKTDAINDLVVSVKKAYGSIPRNRRTITWFDDYIVLQTIDPKNIDKLYNNILQSRNDKKQNEKLLVDIIKNESTKFKYYRNLKNLILPDTSILYFPKDIDILYAIENKYDIWQTQIYKNKKGKYKEFIIDQSKFKFDNTNISITKKQFQVNEKDIKYNKKNINNKDEEYMDFSNGF